MGKLISNDSDSTADVESSGSTAVAVAKPLGKYFITASDLVYFGISCLLIPMGVVADAAACIDKKKDLRCLISSNAQPRNGNRLRTMATFGAVGGVFGFAAMLGDPNPWNYVGCAATGAALFSLGPANAFGALVSVAFGAPLAFREAAKLVSRPYKALRAIGNTPVYKDRPKLQGPK